MITSMAKSVQSRDYCVLHVDDDPAFLDITAEFVDRVLPERTVYSTTDIEEAKTILKEEPIGCIVSDYDMPGTNGLEFLEVVRAEYPDLPFILYTGKGSEEIASQAINAGVTGYIQKGGADQNRRLINRVKHGIAEYRAQVESQRYSTVLEALGYPVYVVDQNERFTYINDAFVDLVGYDREALIGSKPALIKTEDSVEEINELVPSLVSDSGPDIERVEVEIEPQGQQPIPCKDHIAALPFDEEFQGCAGILRDMSAQRERQAALQRKNDQLEQLVSVISHDLQTPLMTAQSAAALASETGDSEQFEQLRQAHDRIDQMLDELVTLAHEGERPTAEDAVSLGPVARAAWEVVDTTDATLQVETEMTVEADPGRLQRLFENLFANAVTHGGQGVAVTVDTLPGERSGFRVFDDGPGISFEQAEAVFDPGFTTDDDGTGFGLAIVQRIADAHGWSVALADGSEGGAQFEFTGVGRTEASLTG